MTTRIRTTLAQEIALPVWMVFLQMLIAVLVGAAVPYVALVVVLDYRHVVFS